MSREVGGGEDPEEVGRGGTVIRIHCTKKKKLLSMKMKIVKTTTTTKPQKVNKRHRHEFHKRSPKWPMKFAYI